MEHGARITRRGSLLKAGGLLAATFVAGCGDDDSGGSSSTAEAAETGGPAGVSSGAVSCVLAPEQTEGPFYVPNEKVRRDITEGRPGAPLTLRLSVLDASSCRAIKGAAVDIWHCDAGGEYSGVRGDDGTFLRGIQRTNAKGMATFRTIYPGWYQGRAVHIHVKVHVAGNVVHTGQLYFRDAVSDAVYRRAPYNERGERDVRNAADPIYRNGGRRSTLSVRRHGNGYVGSIAMGVQRT
jgi:protocatechuate 3,4-dioxygenase beta subunit